jgi:hypothetical protein
MHGLCCSVLGSTSLTLFTHTGFPLALTEQSADRANNEVTAGAAVKKAAQQVETQAQILTTQLNNRVRGTNFAMCYRCVRRNDYYNEFVPLARMRSALLYLCC